MALTSLVAKGEMMSESVLERVHGEIRARMRELQPAAEEYVRLEAALGAIDGVGPQPVPKPARTASEPRRARTPRADGQSAKRAPRGANRAAVLGVLAERPGVEIAELSAASGVSKPVLYNLLKSLEEKSEVGREELPGGRTGYRVGIPGDQSARAEQPADA
jgi:DNA-binding transcriptional ArsR family regulator